MTVKELIEALHHMPEDHEVAISLHKDDIVELSIDDDTNMVVIW